MTSHDQLLHYAFMLLTRRFDARFENLLKTGRVSKWYSEVGNEGTTVPAGLALGPGDVLCTLHRDLGAILAVYLDPARTFPGLGFGTPDGRRPEPSELLETLACQLLGRDGGFSRGVERSFHYGYLAPEAGILHVGMISHLGAMIPVAAGCGLAKRLEGSDRVAINFIGEGGTSTGDFHEGLNMAAVWKLPLVLIVENNHYAFSTPTSSQYAAKRLADRGIGYGVPAVTIDGTDPEAVCAAVTKAVEWARQGEGPTLIEAMLGRMRGHSEGDDSLKVVPREDLERFLAGDPVPGYRDRLRAAGVLTAEVERRLEAQVDELVETAIGKALAADKPRVETAHRPALAPAPGFEAAPPSETVLHYAQGGDDEGSEPVTYIEGIHQALTEEMERDSHVLLMGQDIGAFEGAFRATRGLHERWPERVRDTPIAESGTIGIAIGAALMGFRPIVEMQFADFITCGFNQVVNVAAKLYFRWQVPCPLVIRLPSGGGVGAGPFHSQNPEAWFTHVSGLKVVCPATTTDAKALLKGAIRDPNPVIFCEHKYLYRRVKEVLPSELPPAELGRSRIARRGKDLTLIGYGVSTWTCLEAAEALASEGVEAEVIDLRTLIPLDLDTLLDSLRRTSRVVIVHEAQETGGFGAEVAARLSDAAFAWLDAPIRRVAFEDRPVPYARVLEEALSPTVEKVLKAAREVLAY